MTSLYFSLVMAFTLPPPHCPQYCTEYSLKVIADCARESRNKNGNNDDAFLKDFEACLNKLKDDYLYKRCKKVCNTGEDKNGKKESK